MGPILIAWVTLLAVASAALSWSYLLRIRRAGPLDPAAWTRTLQGAPRHLRASELASRAPPESWEGALAAALVEAAGPLSSPEESRTDARVAVVNDALALVERDLVSGSSWPGAGLRIALYGTGLALATACLVGRFGAMLPIAAIGVAGAAASLVAGRRAKREASRKRAAIDALVESIVGRLTGAPVARPSRRRRSALRRGLPA